MTTATIRTTTRTIRQWVQSDDAVLVTSQANGHDRGDGYDVTIYRSRTTGRYLVEVYSVVMPRYTSWYVAPTRHDAEQVGRAGYTPGSAPGRFRYLLRPDQIREVRATR